MSRMSLKSWMGCAAAIISLCGCAPGSVRGGMDKPCDAARCAEQGKNCGEVMVEGCGVVSCGECDAGHTCGGAGAPNECGAGSCTPTTCQAQNVSCGTMSDGCAGVLDCGPCSTLTAVETPVFLPPATEHVGPLEVSIVTATSGATIYYTMGTTPADPTETSAVYTAPLSVSATTTIAAKAFKAGMSPSATSTASYTIVAACAPNWQCETPVNGYESDGCGNRRANAVCATVWVTVPAGTFLMGSPAGEPCRWDALESAHEVTLTHHFEMASTEATQAQFGALMGYNPSSFLACGGACPVETVNWHEAAAYCNALSAQAGLAKCYDCTGSAQNVTCAEAATYGGAAVYDCPGYRLPTEAEWEHAYRAGTTTAYYSGPNELANCDDCTTIEANADAIAWYCANSGATVHAVAQKQPNAWGLYDLAGNVWEWCHDWHQSDLGTAAVTDPWGAALGPDRMERGGSWKYVPRSQRAAHRAAYNPPESRSNGAGFRCVKSGPAPSDTQPPTIAISSPSDGQVVATSAVTVSGTASDNVGVSKVEVKVGSGTYQTASGTTSWSESVTLASGANTIYARATDSSGNVNDISVSVTQGAASGTNWYVSPAGGGSACSLGSPCSLSYGVNTKAAGGDTVWVLDGTYSPSLIITNSGSAGLPITIKKHSGTPSIITSGAGDDVGNIVIKGHSWITIDGITLGSLSVNRNGIWIDDAGAHDIVVKNTNIYIRPGGGSVYVQIEDGAYNVILANNHMEGGAWNGVTIEGNTISSGVWDGKPDAHDVIIRNNDISGNGIHNSVDLRGNVYNIQIINNIMRDAVVGNLQGAAVFNHQGTAHGIYIIDNKIYNIYKGIDIAEVAYDIVVDGNWAWDMKYLEITPPSFCCSALTIRSYGDIYGGGSTKNVTVRNNDIHGYINIYYNSTLMSNNAWGSAKITNYDPYGLPSGTYCSAYPNCGG